MRLLLLELISIFVSSCAGYNFLEHIEKYMDKSMNPCDNFYRYTCSRDVPYEKTLIVTLSRHAHSWTKQGEEITKKKFPWTPFEKRLHEIGENKELYTSLEHLKEEKPEYKTALKWISLLKLKNFMAYRGARSSIAKDSLVEELMTYVKQELQESAHYPENYKQELLDRMDSIRYLTERSEHITIDVLVKLIEEANKIWLQHPEWNDFDVDDLHQCLNVQLVEMFSGESPLTALYERSEAEGDYLKEQIDQVENMNAANYQTYFIVDDTLWLAAINSTADTLYGSIGYVIGHEVFHSFQHPAYWDEDQFLEKSGKCIVGHMGEVCKEFKEKKCHSGVRSFGEDGSDVEGLQLAYKAFVRKVGKKLMDPFRNTGLTHQQMFFVSYGTFWCLPYGGGADQRDGDNHSATYVRVNGATSLMKAFQDAFQCKPGDTMYELAKHKEDCNTFGKPVRKLHGKD